MSARRSGCESYLDDQRVQEAITRAVARVLDERPPSAVLRLGQLLVEAAPAENGAGTSVDPAVTAWEPFQRLLSDVQQQGAEGTGDGDFIESLQLGPDEYLHAPPNAELHRSMEEEFRDNDGGRWWAEYEYVVYRAAEEGVNEAAVVRDAGHTNMTLDDFAELPQAREAGLSLAEVAGLRLHTGPLGAPLNRALRSQQTAEWATTLAVHASCRYNMSRCCDPSFTHRLLRR